MTDQSTIFNGVIVNTGDIFWNLNSCQFAIGKCLPTNWFQIFRKCNWTQLCAMSKTTISNDFNIWWQHKFFEPNTTVECKIINFCDCFWNIDICQSNTILECTSSNWTDCCWNIDMCQLRTVCKCIYLDACESWRCLEYTMLYIYILISHPLIMFSSVQSLSHVQLFATPWTAARQASLSITNSRSFLKLMSIESVVPSNHLILSPPSPPALNLPQHQGVFQWVSSSHQVARVLELQLQHPPFQWIFRTDFL